MTKGIFITATGTDIGKTYISGLLVKKMRDLGYNCGYFKPALSGAEMINGKLVPGDCAHVLKTAGINDDPMKYVSYVFETAVSPHLAAQLEGNSIKKEKIKSDSERLKSEYEYLVVEGAGGIVCPFNLTDEKLMLPDIIKLLNLDVIIVASASLGTINSTVLTAEYIKSLGINIRGIILNKYNDNDFMQKDNKEQVEKLTGIKVIAVVKDKEKDLKIKEEELLSIFKEI